MKEGNNEIQVSKKPVRSALGEQKTECKTESKKRQKWNELGLITERTGRFGIEGRGVILELAEENRQLPSGKTKGNRGMEWGGLTKRKEETDQKGNERLGRKNAKY